MTSLHSSKNDIINKGQTTTMNSNNNNNNRKYNYKHILLFVTIHCFVILLYAIPMFLPSQYNNRNNAVLDELHIVSTSNHDVNGRQNDTLYSIVQHIFTNDYWGRPMTSSNSHKSWRPLSIILFRYVRGFALPNNNMYNTNSKFIKFFTVDLNIHRLVNIITHATVAELVSQLSTKLYIPISSNSNVANARNKLILRCMTKILWALHPTHVEVTANAANRPHLLALLCSIIISDPDTSLILFILSNIFGYLFCETFIFQIIPASIMLISIQYIRLFHYNTTSSSSTKTSFSIMEQLFRRTIIMEPKIFLRLILLGLFGILYYSCRYYYDTLSIPSGLIRPAENPFYQFEGLLRIRSYLYLLAIHIAKQWNIDFIGFSHEYGFECIRAVTSWYDIRLLIPLTIILLHIIVGIYLLYCQKGRTILSGGFILYFVHMGWSMTLFPIAGVIKIGTFISDRLTVPSTVSVSIILSHIMTSWIVSRPIHDHRTKSKILFIVIIASVMWIRVYQRSCEWMDSLPLLESSIRTCPRFAKAHLEISKIYSGLYPDKFDLKRSRKHLEEVERIDPNFCDVHQQFAHIAIQEQKHLEFEERLTNSLLCPFTMGASIELWRRYWDMTLNSDRVTNAERAAAQKRHQKFQERINEAIANDKEASRDPESKSPLIGWRK